MHEKLANILSHNYSMGNRTRELYDECLARLSLADVRWKTAEQAARMVAHTEGLKPTTQNVYIAACLKDGVEPEAEKLLKEQQATNHKLINATYDISALTDEQKRNWVAWSKLGELRDSLENYSNRTDMYRHLLLTLFTKFAPQRNEYADCKVVTRLGHVDSKGNFYVREGGQLVLQNYKTQKTYGRRTLSLPKEVVRVIEASLGRYPRQWLLETSRGTPWSRNMLSQFLRKRYVGMTLGSCLLRKIAKTTWEQQGCGGSHLLALSMGHAPATATRYYDQNNRADVSHNALGLGLGRSDNSGGGSCLDEKKEEENPGVP